MVKGNRGNEERLVIKGVILDTNIAIGLLNDNRKVVEKSDLSKKKKRIGHKSPRFFNYCNSNL